MTAPDAGEAAPVQGTVEESELTTASGPCEPSDLAKLTGRARVWFERAAGLHNAGRPALAAELLSRALMLEPTFACLREALGRAQFDAQQFLAARMTFSAMTAINPLDHYAFFGLALAETALDDHVAATRHLERAAGLAPDEIRYAIALEHARFTMSQEPSAQAGRPAVRPGKS